MSAVPKTNSFAFNETGKSRLTEIERKLIYARAGMTEQQVHNIECMVAESATRLVGKGALDNVRSHLASKKNGNCCVVESHTCERVFAYELEHDRKVRGYIVQAPCRGIFRYRTDGTNHVSNATLDFLVFYEDSVELVECKTESWLAQHEAQGEWQRTTAGWTSCPYGRWAEDKGLAFRVWTPPSPVGIYLRNLESSYAMVDVALVDEEERAAKKAASLIAKRPYSIAELSRLVRGFRERTALWLIANQLAFGLLRSTPVHCREQFILYNDKERAETADRELLTTVVEHLEACSVQLPLHLATTTDYDKGKERVDRLDRIAKGEEKPTRRMSLLAAQVRKATAAGVSALTTCLTSHARSGNRSTRLDPVQEECTDWAITNLWNTGKVKDRKALWFNLEDQCKRRGAKAPHPNTLWRRVRREDTARRALMTGGMRAYQAAKPSSDPRHRSGKALGYGVTLHIDSSQFDNRCAPMIERAFPGEKPWFYVGIDEATGLPMAHALIFGRARSRGVAILLRTFVERHGFLPTVIVLDRGSENESKWLRQFCLEAGITLLYTPTGGSRYNGQAENCIKQINHCVAHDLPGSTEPDMKGRSVDGKYKSKKTAKLSFLVLNEALEKFIYDDLANTPDNNDETPIEKRDESIARFGQFGRLCTLDDDMRIKTSVPLPFRGKATEKRGIRTEEGAFTSDELKQLLRTSKPDEVRQDCIDWTVLYVKIKAEWVKAFHSAVLSQACLSKVERIFESLYRPIAKATRRAVKREIDRVRHHRHAEVVAASKSAQSHSSPAREEPYKPECEGNVDEQLQAVLWDDIEPIQAEKGHD
jgi:putative transposase